MILPKIVLKKIEAGKILAYYLRIYTGSTQVLILILYSKDSIIAW